MTAAEIARHLHGRKSGSGWMARCPAHDDREPSLSLQDVSGKLLVHCHAGCPQAAVVAALKALGLWTEPRQSMGIIVATYDYCDESGELLYQVVRTDPKGYFQWRPDGFGGWINKKNKRQVLYRLRELTEAPIVFVVEGEKDADLLRQHGCNHECWRR
jgi:putative DNA primase/helicase